ENLEYISSAGLRVLLRVKKTEKSMEIINVDPQVYDIFEMTGFTEMLTIRKKYRRMSVDGCEVLGEGANGIVYRYDPEIVVKVYRSPDALDAIRRERELARKALVLGLPTAIPFDVVKVGEQYATVFELLNARSFSKLINADRDNIEFYADLFVDLMKQIHSTEVSPEDMVNEKDVALDWVTYLEGRIPDDQYEKLYNLVNAIPDRYTMLHGDYHTNNVEMQNGEVLLIDMDTLCYGHPIFELSSMYMAFVGFGELDGGVVERFFKMPYELSCSFWKAALKRYLETDDEAAIAALEDKAKLITYARLLRRAYRKMADQPEAAKYFSEKLAETLERVDTLEI
ncbi:MAG: phosphotransferase, partial [Oscillospiraceae bacterium]|nr:phosphotransferase [Oscillospiraceae bacterium]